MDTQEKLSNIIQKVRKNKISYIKFGNDDMDKERMIEVLDHVLSDKELSEIDKIYADHIALKSK